MSSQEATNEMRESKDLASFRAFLRDGIGAHADVEYEEPVKSQCTPPWDYVPGHQWRALNFLNGVEVARECEQYKGGTRDETEAYEEAVLINRIRLRIQNGDTHLIDTFADIEFTVEGTEMLQTAKQESPAVASGAEMRRLFIFFSAAPILNAYLAQQTEQQP